MFKNCKNLFDLSRKLGSVVTGLGLAGVLFAGQVSAAPPRKTAKWCNLAEQNVRYARIYTPDTLVSWTDEDIEHLANVVAGLVNSGRDINWDAVAEQLNRLTDGSRTAEDCRLKWIQLTDEHFRNIL